MFSRLWHRYLTLLDTHPLSTKCVTSGLIMLAGDAIQQGIEYKQKKDEWQVAHTQSKTMQQLSALTSQAAALTSSSSATMSQSSSTSAFTLSSSAFPSFAASYDVPRSIRSGVFGALAVGPIFHVWFNRLDRFIPGSTFKPVAKKMLIDQGFMAPVFTVFYFGTMGVMEGKSTSEIRRKIETATVPTLIANYCIFPFSQFVNFMFVPERLRVLILNAGGLVYNVYLSRYNAAADEEEQSENREPVAIQTLTASK